MSSPQHMVAKVLEPTEAGLEEAGSLLRAGRCVAFPTETVYGLGANALDASAVLNIFMYKGRPLTDPLIVHVNTVDEALMLVELGPSGTKLLERLATAFWPGPLTIVARAAPVIPSLVTAGTGYVGVRSPSHAIARALLDKVWQPRSVALVSPRLLTCCGTLRPAFPLQHQVQIDFAT
jgi:L-threonylcarbamoyladenylate synthase